jgi:Zn-dependent alcohol dehydrogenase
MTRIRAAVCRTFNEPLQIETLDMAPPAPGEVEVTLKACAICHSDIAFANGAWGGHLPAVYGHEAAGEITALGAGVTGVALGDRVIVTLIKSCGSCPSCGKGLPAICGTATAAAPLATPDGEEVHRAMYCGAFAEKTTVDASQIAAIPDEIPYDVASLLSCGVITGVGAVVNAAKLQPGEDVVIIGAGGVGLNAIQGARLAGAGRIVAVDLVAEKLEDAKTFGATNGVLVGDGDPTEAVKSLLGKGADAVFVTVGATRVFNSAPDYLAAGGRVVLVGIPPSGDLATYAPDVVSSAGQSLIGTKMGNTVLSRDIPWLTELYLQGRLKLDELISARWSLDQINEAIADTKTGAARRNVIMFD